MTDDRQPNRGVAFAWLDATDEEAMAEIDRITGGHDMSYAGTYGADETCRHDTYWRSCRECSEVGPRATAAQVREARERRLALAAKADAEAERKKAERHTSTVVRDGFGRIISEAAALIKEEPHE